MKNLLRWSKQGDSWIGCTFSPMYSNCHLTYQCTEHLPGTDSRYYTVKSVKDKRSSAPRWIHPPITLKATVRKLAYGKELCEFHAQQQLGTP